MRRLSVPAIAAIVVAVLAFDVFVLPPALNFFFAPRSAPGDMPPVAANPPAVVNVFEATTEDERQFILKPVKDSPDQNAFHDETVNRSVLGLSRVRWRFHQLVVANFSRTDPFEIDLAETPLEVRLEPGGRSVRAVSAADVLAEAGSSVPRSGAFLLETLGRGPARVELAPASLASILVALPADLLDEAKGASIASASLLFAAGGMGASPGDGLTLLPATVRKESLDDFLLSPVEPLAVEREPPLLSLVPARLERE